MKYIFRIGVFVCIFSLGFITREFLNTKQTPSSTTSPLSDKKEDIFEQYTIPSLRMRVSQGSDIIFDEPVATESAYTVYNFHFYSKNKKVTGLAHVPNISTRNIPVIVQFRGYVDREIYTSGTGTSHSAEVYAQNGYMTLAPDFLGYGGSDMPSEKIFEERFETYTTALDLLSSVSSIPEADNDRIGLWGHSNGGHIALAVLEILMRDDLPTTLWAPVTKPFPYSVLYFTDELVDEGKYLRSELAKLEDLHDAREHSIVRYVGDISSPLQIHQGTADDAVPQEWNDSFVRILQENEKDIQYFVYPGADHNMVPLWDSVVARDIQFFQTNL